MPTSQVIIEAYTQSSTGLPKDRFINVWHFLDVTDADVDDVAYTGGEKIADFFTGPTGISGVGAVETAMSTSASDLMTLIAYDFAAATPRPELGRFTFTLTPSATEDLPEEVALCLSYYTDRNVASHRGRLYIGPLNVSAMAGSGEPPRPNSNWMAAMRAGGIRLTTIGKPAVTPTFVTNTMPGVPNTTAAWALYSPKLGTFSAIEHGWVDDEWDGQRRRRVEASTRLTW